MSGCVLTASGVALPRLELEARHVHEACARRGVVGERVREVAGVPLAPEAVLHEVHPLDERIAVELGGQQLVQLAEGLLELRVVVARLDGGPSSSRTGRPMSTKGTLRAGNRRSASLRAGCWGSKAARGRRPAGRAARERRGSAATPGGRSSRPGRALHVAPVAADVEHVARRGAPRASRRVARASRRPRRAASDGPPSSHV